MSSLFASSELLATYAGLGTHDGEHYYKGEECLGKLLSQSHSLLARPCMYMMYNI